MKRLLIILILLVPWAGQAEKADENELSFGVVLGLTGYAAEHADAIKKGVVLAADQLEEKGWKINLKIEDDQTQSAKTVAAIRTLLSQGYHFFIGPTWSYQTKAAEPILRSNNAVALIPGGSSLINGGASDVLFNMCPRRDKQTPLITEWVKTLPGKRAFILSAHGDWGEIHHRVFADAVKKAGGEIVSEEFFDYGIDLASLQSILLRAATKKFDVLFATTSSSDIATIIKAREQLKMNFTLMTTDTIEDALRLKLVKKEHLHDVFMTHLPINPEFSELHKKNYGEEAQIYSDRGFDAVMVLAQAVKNTDGSVNAVKHYLKNDLKMNGYVGKIEFDDRGDIVASNYKISSLN